METEPFVKLPTALQVFASSSATQSQAHIKPLHLHMAQRLVIEGGFRPELVSPRPALRIDTTGSRHRAGKYLVFDDSVANESERTILGGLKTKQVDVVVDIPGVGPAIAISVKGTLNAFRNLTNRMEEAVGDCTNLHLIYPGLVYGFLHVLRANKEHEVTSRNDIALLAGGAVAEGIVRYHDILLRLTGRSNVRDEASLYEAVSMGLVDTGLAGASMMTAYPPTESPLHYDRFFPTLLSAYDQRFVYAAPALAARTSRVEWDADSPAIKVAQDAGFVPRAA